MSSSTDEPVVVAIDMGYGHLRPAHALADAAGTRVLPADGEELAGPSERALWRRIRTTYEAATRWSARPLVGAPFRVAVEALTRIHPLHPHRDQSRPDVGTRRFERMFAGGLGEGLIGLLRETGRPLLTTYFTPALAADRAGCERVYCVVTDSDIHRVWAPHDPARTRIRYLVPTPRAMRRLRAYGVPRERIRVTGYPLPTELLGGPSLEVLQRNLSARLARLDPTGRFREDFADVIGASLGEVPGGVGLEPPLVTFAVGGAGAQVGLLERALPSLKRELAAGRVRLALVAGVRAEVAARFGSALRSQGLENEVEVLLEPDVPSYLARFNELLGRTDVLWTKPSEMTFFGGLGLALALAPPVGVHERYNRRWARENGAGIKQRDARHLGEWLRECLEDGLLASAAWAGYARLPNRGLFRVLEEVGCALAPKIRHQQGKEKVR